MPKLSQLIQDGVGGLAFTKHWMESAFDRYDQEQQREPYVRTHFSPSSAHKCPRELYYHMKGYTPDPIESQSLRRMGVGTVFHEFVESKLTATGLMVSSEEEVTYDDPPIRGYYDAIIKRPSDGKDLLLEVKSMADPKNPKYAQTLPYHSHLVQWNLYSLMTGIDEGIVFYINKNNQEYVICETERNDNIIKETLDKFRRVQEYLDRDELYPYVPEEKHSWCNFKTTCEKHYFVEQI